MLTLKKRMDAVEGRLQIIEEQQDRIYNALKLLLQGHWTGEMPHAEAFVKSVSPEDSGTWQAVPFDGPGA